MWELIQSIKTSKNIQDGSSQTISDMSTHKDTLSTGSIFDIEDRDLVIIFDEESESSKLIQELSDTNIELAKLINKGDMIYHRMYMLRQHDSLICEDEPDIFINKVEEQADRFIVEIKYCRTRSLPPRAKSRGHVCEPLWETGTSRQLRRQVEVLSRDTIEKWLKEQEYEKAEKMMHDAEVQTEIQSEGNVKEQGIQTDTGEGLTQIEGVDTYQKFKEIMDKNWEENIYENTEIKIGNPLETKMTTVKVVMTEKGDKNMERGIQRLYKKRYPELLEGDENYEVLEQTTNYKNAKQKMGQKLIRIELSGREEDLWEQMERMKKDTEGDEWVAMHKINEINIDMFRKMVETILHGTKTHAVIYTNNQQRIQDGEKTNGERGKGINKEVLEDNKQKKTYAIVLNKVEDEEIKETIRKIRESVKGTGANKEIQGLRTTKDGNILVEMGKKLEGANEIKKAIEEATKLKTRIMGPN
ncbi:uncharacterized protein [Euwallacea fornicatus]|uniref:uncharacterized protein n=1 Tax=Euwallacea fornicatus TaxID=995702 RepID=UPI00338FF841